MPTVSDPVTGFSAALLGRRILNANIGAPATHLIGSLIGRRGLGYTGSGSITGTVAVEGTPSSRQVRLFDKKTAVLIAQTYSSLTGQYEFKNLDPLREYFVVSHDYARVFNAVVQDMIQP